MEIRTQTKPKLLNKQHKTCSKIEDDVQEEQAVDSKVEIVSPT